MKQMYFFFALSFLIGGIGTSMAQTLSFADAIDQLARACRADLQKYCKGVELGGGRIRACLDAKQGMISANCQQTRTRIYQSIARRTAAQRSIAQICSADIQRFCPGIVAGDANVLTCMLDVKPSFISRACNQAITDTGWRTERAQQ